VATDFAWSYVPLYILMQFLGAMLGAFLVWVMYKDHLDQTDAGGQLAVFATGPAIRNIPRNLVCEIIATFVLLFMLTRASILNLDVWVWFVILAIGISLGGTTGYALNPARCLGPRIMHAILPMKGKGSSEWGYSWVTVVGPIIGGILGALAAVAVFG